METSTRLMGRRTFTVSGMHSVPKFLDRSLTFVMKVACFWCQLRALDPTSMSMRTSKSTLQLFLFAVIILLIVILHNSTLPYLTLGVARVVGVEETIFDFSVRPLGKDASNAEEATGANHLSGQGQRIHFRPGIPKAPGSGYSKVMVIPRTKDEDIGWIAEELPDLDLSVYIVDEPNAPLHPPKNKGHEVMVYLSYIIDHYDSLPDIVIFMHAHRWTYHNNDILGADASHMIRRLSKEHVVREGYVNMRCAWTPGCPKWLYFNSSEELMVKQEETYLARSWKELFPLEPLPSYLAQPCCAQFAISSERIRSIPRSRFVFYRDWMMKTPLTDYISGRIMEYSWQYIFTGKGAICPAEHICHCDMYGICFGGSTQYEHFVQLELRRKEFERDLEKWKEADQSFKESLYNSNLNVTTNVTGPDQKQVAYLHEQIGVIDKERDILKEKAMKRGDDPKLRAEEVGRPWREGDGF